MNYKNSIAINYSTKEHLLEKESDSGSTFEIKACLSEDLIPRPRHIFLVDTGIVLHMNKGYECQIQSRLDLAIRNNVVVINAPSTTHATYRGAIRILLFNLGGDDCTVCNGTKIANLIFSRVLPFDLQTTKKGQSFHEQRAFEWSD